MAALRADPDPEPDRPSDPPERAPDRITRLFGSRQFFRLWVVQVTSATGDWLGFSAIILLAAKVAGTGAGAGAGAISIVLAARIVPGFLFGPWAGVLVDRWDRKRVMMACDLGRATVIACLPFVKNLPALVVASLALEAFTLLWSPAKEASVPKLVPRSHLASANSLSLAAAYGTFPFSALLFAVLAGVSGWLGRLGGLHVFALDQMALAFYVDALTFVVSAALVSRLAIGGRRAPVRRAAGLRWGVGQALSELREGWQYIFINPTVRAVNLGLATGLIGGGMLIPLGAVYASDVLHSGPTGYGLFTTALGFGVAVGAIGVAVLQRHLPLERVFTTCLLLAGSMLFIAASAGTLLVAVVAVGLMGVAVGPVYVAGFALLQHEVTDDLRGRVFSSLNSLVRLCVLTSMIAGPLIAALLGGISARWLGGSLDLGGLHVGLPGVRLALWLASVIIIGSGILALHSVRAGQRSKAFRAARHPSQWPRPYPEARLGEAAT